MARRQESKKAPIPHKVFSDRGLRLEKAHKEQHNSNLNHDQTVVIDPDKDGTGEPVIVKIGQRCPKCGKRVRGPNHVKGDHHLRRVPKHTRH